MTWVAPLLLLVLAADPDPGTRAREVTPDAAEEDADADPPARDLANPAEILADRTRPPVQRRNAARKLARMRWEGSAEALSAALRTDPAPSVRVVAAAALGARVEGGGVLAEALQWDPDARVRRAAAGALGAMGADGTRQETALLAALDDPAQPVRLEAARALERVGSRASVDVLRDARRDAAGGPERTALRRAQRASEAHAREHDRRRRADEETRVAMADPATSAPLLARAWRHGGVVVATLHGGLAGGLMGGLAPAALGGSRWAFTWPLGAAFGLAAGAASGVGYAAVRGFDLPVPDAVLIAVHGGSGLAAGVGLGLWLNRSSPMQMAGLGILGGTAFTLVSAGVSPWVKSRLSVPMWAGSGGLVGGALALAAAGAAGHDVRHQPELALGLAFVGQGAGTLLGTAVAAGVPVTSLDAALVDVGTLLGGALGTGALLVLSRSGRSPPALLTWGPVVGGIAVGAGGGAVVAALLPAAWERRVEAALEPVDWPFKLVPQLPLPVPLATDDGRRSRTTGAVVPVLGGTFR